MLFFFAPCVISKYIPNIQQVFQHIFTGHLLAISKTSQASKPSKAQLHGLTEVTGWMIAYVAVQVHFMSCQHHLTVFACCRLILYSAPSTSGNALIETLIMMPFTKILSSCFNTNKNIGGLGKYLHCGINMCEPLFRC